MVLVDREIQLMKIYLVAPILLLCASITSSLIAAPVINKLTPVGLQAGQDVILTVDGTDLLPNPRLIASFPIETQEIQANPAANKVTLKLKIPADVDTGIHTIRIASDGGSSNSLAIAVDRLPQQAFGENISALPMAVNGQLAGGTILKTEFAGKQGMKIVVDVEARRLGSMMRPVIRLINSRGTQLAWSPPQPSLQGDARCETELPADGSYTIQLHDLLYKGPQPGYFRLKVGELQYRGPGIPDWRTARPVRHRIAGVDEFARGARNKYHRGQPLRPSTRHWNQRVVRWHTSTRCSQQPCRGCRGGWGYRQPAGHSCRPGRY